MLIYVNEIGGGGDFLYLLLYQPIHTSACRQDNIMETGSSRHLSQTLTYTICIESPSGHIVNLCYSNHYYCLRCL